VLLTPNPIVAQLPPMEFRPVENQPESPTRQPSLDDFQRLDRDFRFMLAVYRVKVRWRVIVVIHSDDDPEEDAECGHENVGLVPLYEIRRQGRPAGVTLTENARLAEVLSTDDGSDFRGKNGVHFLLTLVGARLP
jgi:hypothetical protein